MSRFSTRSPSASRTPSPSPRRWRPGASGCFPATKWPGTFKRGFCARRRRIATRWGTARTGFGEGRGGEKVVLGANPDYFEGRPYLSRIVYRIIPSQSTIFLELKAKGVHYVGSLTAIQFVRQTNYPAFRKAFHKYEYPANVYTYFGFNLKDPRFADRRVRQAL